MATQDYITSVAEQPVVAIRRKAKTSEFTKIFGEVFSNVKTYITEKGATITGAPFVQYFGSDWEAIATKNPFLYMLKNFGTVYDFYAGMPVSETIASHDDIESFSFPAGQYYQFEHQGSYIKLGKTYKTYISAALNDGIALKSEFTEFYLNAPGEVPTAELRTLIQIPLAE